jgi:DNA-binding transcriptional MerR regulator
VTRPGSKNMAHWLLLSVGLGSSACGAGANGEAQSPSGTAQARNAGSGNDGSRCEHQGRMDREVQESFAAGAVQPSIRRVYRAVGEGEQRRRILVCREVDTNLDGIKDLVRHYSDQGEAVEEQADSNYDGELDTWTRFSKGRVSQVGFDTNRDGTPDETRFYQRGRLSRVQRDTNGDTKPDIWEIYAGGRLERMGIDVDFDGRVDRWNRDEIAARENERAGIDAEADDEGATGAVPTETSSGSD